MGAFGHQFGASDMMRDDEEDSASTRLRCGSRFSAA